MYSRYLPLALGALPAVYAWPQPQQNCKCGPNDRCWPSTSQWEQFNNSLGGKLIADTPPAISCYPGPDFDAQTCAAVNVELTNQSFVADNPIALSYPTDSCPPLNLQANPCSIGYSNSAPCATTNGTATPPGTCSIGDQPRYTVNATEVYDVEAAINFAKEHNIRLVVRNTGHDILRRSTGYGSLQVWIRYLRKGTNYEEQYTPSEQCSKSTWFGPAFTIGGGYTWEDVYPEAASRNVVVVGGGTPSVGCLGGWMQGGGHSPATHNYGLGADQVLEALVVLPSGRTVLASPCHHPELLFAIRGGGPASYGVVVSTTIKAHPQPQGISAQIFGFAPLSQNDTPTFMNAVNIVYQNYPNLSDAGFSGYGSWSLYSPTPLIPSTNYTTAFIHTIANFGKSAAEAQALFAPVAAQLDRYNGTQLFFYTKYLSFPTYASYYSTLSDVVTPVGSTSGALGSRLLDRQALTGSPSALRTMLNTIAGTPSQATSNNIVFVGGGRVAADASDPYSGVNPAWRGTYVHNIVARGWAPGSSNATIAAVHNDITNIKTPAMKALAPDTGCYMNEADRFDPTYLADFYGANQNKLSQIKQKYDPQNVFYCPTCIGSENWAENGEGVLCEVQSGGPDNGEEGYGYGWGERRGHDWRSCQCLTAD